MDTDILVAIISPCVAGIVTYYFSTKTVFSPIKFENATKELYKVYLPLYKFLEPNLYNEATNIDFLKQFLVLFNSIKELHYELIDSNLINDISIMEASIFENKYTYVQFESICYSVDKLFERKRKFLKLPTRTLIYKINNKQFPKSCRDLFNLLGQGIINSLPMLLIIMIVMFITLVISAIYQVILKLI